MGKLITILGGCLVVASGVSYGLYVNHHGCPLAGSCPAPVAVSAECCDEADACPYSSVGTSAGDAEGCCPLSAAARATGGTAPSRVAATPCCASGRDDCCTDADKACCAATGCTGLQAVAGAALAGRGK